MNKQTQAIKLHVIKLHHSYLSAVTESINEMSVDVLGYTFLSVGD